MQERIKVKVSPEKIWDSWERAHKNQGGTLLADGQRGLSKGSGSKGFRYQICDVVVGKQFSILWKTFFVRLLFSHSVSPASWGSEVLYSVEIKGLFAWPVRWLLGNKIRQNLRIILQEISRRLEEESVVDSSNRRGSQRISGQKTL